ncbi:MAG: choice-of-anchor E domain-containing protein [Sedimentisphaerales bacterium]|jgi:hypothetical protein
MLKIFLTVLILAFFIGSSVQADTITYSDSISGLFDLVSGGDIIVPQFDPSLGTLNSALFTFNTTIQGSSGFENLKRIGGTFSVTANNFAGITVSYNGNQLTGAGYSDGKTYNVTLGAYDGTLNYGGTSGTILAAFSNSVPYEMLCDPIQLPQLPPWFQVPLPQLVGTGNFDFSVTTDYTMQFYNMPANSSGAFDTLGQASVSVNYDYNPIPEPATIALLSLGGLLLRKRK